MSEPTTRTLDETFQERTGALPPADFTPDRIMRAARGQQRRHRAYGTLGGVAAAGLVVALALQSGHATTSSPQPATTRGTTEASLTIEQVARANAGYAWAMGLPPGPPEQRDLGFQVVPRGEASARLEGDKAGLNGERVAVILDRGEALLPLGVLAVSSPMKVASGWLFVGHRSDRTGEGAVDELGSTVLLVRSDLTVRTVVEAEVVASILPSPDGQAVGVVTGTVSGDGEIAFDAARFVRLASGEAMEAAALPDATQAAAIATWDGDRVTFVGRVGGPPSSRVHVYDLAQRRWSTEEPRVEGGTSVGLLAVSAAEGGPTSQAFVVLHGVDAESCVHVMTGASISPEALVCAPEGSDLVADVSPGARYAVVGEGYRGRVNTGHPARVIDLATGREMAGVPAQLLDVGAFYLIWENEHALIGQATRATPVHDSATLFRWDLATASGESLGWDTAQGPMRVEVNPHVAVLL